MKNFALLLFLAAASCGRHEAVRLGGSQTSLPVKVHTAALNPEQAMEDVVGTVRSRQRAVVEAKVSGRILEYLAAPGQMVKEGDLLARLDVQEIQARVTQARAVADQARRDVERQRQLVGQGATTRQEFEFAEAREKVAAAGLAEAETMLGYARVGAPFSGVITRKLAEMGDLAMPGKPLLEMEAPSSLRFEADLPEAILDRIKPGAQMSVTIPSVPGALDATVSEISPVADAASRTFLVKFDLPETPGLRTGQFGRVAVPMAQTQVLRVPAAAVTRRGQMETVFVIHDSHARLRLVKSGRTSAAGVEILSGLEPGEQVALPVTAQPADGQPVTIQP